MKHSLQLLFLLLTSLAMAAEPEHVVVARETGKFLGWPANHGPMHAWGDELLVAFTAAEHRDNDGERHPYDPAQPQHVWLARSLDGGRSWKVERPEALRGHKNLSAAPVLPTTGGIRSDNPDCLVICGYEDEDRGRSWFQVSTDRGRSWGARQSLPNFGLTGVNGRTDYTLSGQDDALFLFTTLSAHKAKEGRVFAARTRDGGKIWTHTGWVGPDHADGFSIQPATVRLDPRRLVTVTRWQRPGRSGLEVHASEDDGQNWQTLGQAAETGERSTAHDLTRLRDGRVALTYAQRDRREICAKLSADDGRTWSEEIVVRGKAGNWDLGYPRTAQRTDGTLVTAYYWNDDPKKERQISATLWRAPDAPKASASAVPVAGRQVVAHYAAGRFAGWPANGGLWTWNDGKDVLAGFATGAFKEQPNHNIEPPFRNELLRSSDGGENWGRVDAANYAQQDSPRAEAGEVVDFTSPNLVVRVMSTGYHGSADPLGCWLASKDRGATWSARTPTTGLADAPELAGFEITGRTDYLAVSPTEAVFFMSARQRQGADRAFAAKVRDGGARWEFLGWMTPTNDPHRSVMPSTVRLPSGQFVSALRRRELAAERNWIDVVTSDDGGRSWRFLSWVGDAGNLNGNPPALLRLRDGRLCCAFGDRVSRRILARISADEGQSWGPLLVLRDNFQTDKYNDADLGYPRMFQRPDGRLVTVYYWASTKNPEPHIAMTIWQPTTN